MLIRTNLSWNTLARYSTMMWNNGEDGYTIGGDAFNDCMEDVDEEDRFLDFDYLKSDCEWQIEKHQEMMDEEFASYHQDYLDGWRDDMTIEKNNLYLKARKDLNNFKREYRAWAKTIEVVPEWIIDTDKDEFFSFTYTSDKAHPILH